MVSLQDVYLLDKKNNVLQKLNLDPEYNNFHSDIVIDSTGSRFILYFVPTGELPDTGKVSVQVAHKPQVEVYSVHRDIFIGNCIPGSQVMVFDMLGNLCYKLKTVSSSEIIRTNSKDGCLIVRINNENFSVSRKIIIRE